ncbi:hypothetical protein [Embleya sp. NPDC005575]|uniref:hypothetical protein n=1 Tax=Embleya sp. NPDC005575 TaxID=3156892 RepID=UPI0033B08804
MDTADQSPSPDRGDLPFATLFPPHLPGDPWRPTARTAALLHTSLSLLADEIDDDIRTHGDRPVEAGAEGSWSVLHRLPRSTWDGGTPWRRNMAAAVDDLIADLERGRLPFPRCPAKHHGLGLALADAEATLDEDPDLVADEAAHLPADPRVRDRWRPCP